MESWQLVSSTTVNSEKETYTVYEYVRTSETLEVIDYMDAEKIVVNCGDKTIELDYETWREVSILIYENILW